MPEKIVVIGGGGHAKVLINVIQKLRNFQIVGYVDHRDFGNLSGVQYLGNDDFLYDLVNKKITSAALGVGQVHLTDKRNEIINRIKELGFKFPFILSPDAVINKNVIIEDGVHVFDGVVINCDSIIRDFSIINTNSTIEHDCIIGKFCHIASGATLSGGVEIGDNSMIGSNAVVVQYKKITKNTLIGSGGVVINDILESGTYVGNPVRKV